MGGVKRHVPELRFGGFEGEWKEKSLEALAEVSRGKFTPRPRNDPRYYGGSTPFVQTGDIASSETFLTEYSQTLNELGVTVSKVFPKDTILMTIAANIGDVALTTFPVACPDSLVGICAYHSVDVMWLFHKLSTRKNELSAYATQNAQANINLQVLKPLKIYSTQKEEQQKIAAFLGAVDDKLTALRRKRELLQEYKRGMMQKIFSRELRFKGDDGGGFPDWEEILASKLFSNHSNKNHNGDLPILAITQDNGAVFRDDIDIKIISSAESVQSYKIIEEGDFIISLRSFQGGIEYSRVKGICSPAYTVLKPQLNICDDFYRYYFKKADFISRLSATTVGIREGKQISYSAFGTLKLVYPCLAEQQKIADFLSAIDRKIEAVAGQIVQVETFKKGLLQKMFV